MSYRIENDEEEDEPIVVVGRRNEEVNEDPDLGTVWRWADGDFWLGGSWWTPPGGLGTSGVSGPNEPVPPDTEEEEEADIVVTAPSRGQEHFADDGDVFNDGEAPTFDTVISWLDAMLAEGYVITYSILARDPENLDEGYDGTYATSDGDRYEFESDGGENYSNFLRSRIIDPLEPQPDPPIIAFGPDHWDIALH